jgi:hypothetical protein
MTDKPTPAADPGKRIAELEHVLRLVIDYLEMDGRGKGIVSLCRRTLGDTQPADHEQN